MLSSAESVLIMARSGCAIVVVVAIGSCVVLVVVWGFFRMHSAVLGNVFFFCFIFVHRPIVAICVGQFRHLDSVWCSGCHSLLPAAEAVLRVRATQQELHDQGHVDQGAGGLGEDVLRMATRSSAQDLLV